MNEVGMQSSDEELSGSSMMIRMASSTVTGGRLEPTKFVILIIIMSILTETGLVDRRNSRTTLIYFHCSSHDSANHDQFICHCVLDFGLNKQISQLVKLKAV